MKRPQSQKKIFCLKQQIQLEKPREDRPKKKENLEDVEEVEDTVVNKKAKTRKGSTEDPVLTSALNLDPDEFFQYMQDKFKEYHTSKPRHGYKGLIELFIPAFKNTLQIFKLKQKEQVSKLVTCLNHNSTLIDSNNNLDILDTQNPQ